jgi:chaperonin GroEL (HSP60 family)
MLPNIRYRFQLGNYKDSKIIKGVILDFPFPKSFPSKIENSRVILFNTSLVPSSQTETELDGVTYKLNFESNASNPNWSVEQTQLKILFQMVEKLAGLGVKILLCQKVIHPKLQDYLLKLVLLLFFFNNL